VSQENVEVVRQFFLGTNERDLDAALSNVAADAELDWSASDAPDSGVFRGPGEWRKWLAGRIEELDARFDVTEIIDVPPYSIVTVVHMRGRGRASGVDVAQLGAAVWTLRDGQIVRTAMCQTKGQALKAVGLEE
jgi:ketosteroid isomerase-like protein